MAKRKIIFANDEYYHVFNRGVARMPIFQTRRDYLRYIRTVQYYNRTPINSRFSHFLETEDFLIGTETIVDIVTFAFMPNHFHFLLRQRADDGIKNFISKITNSYVKYFNIKHDRVGPLFQGNFKAVLVESMEQLIHVDRYIHLNPVVSRLAKNPEDYEWTSYNEHLGTSARNICDREVIKGQFKNLEQFEKFTKDHIGYAKKLDEVKHLLHDTEV